MSYIRLRQICLVARDIELAERQLSRVFGLSVSHRDDRVEKYGLVNFVMPVNHSFLEVVVPTRDGTTAGRFLDRFGGRGAYMAMFDCSDFSHWRGLVEAAGVRIAKYQDYPRYEHMQLHPKDTGATMLEIHHNRGGDDLFGHYDPGGEGWRDHIRTELVGDLLGGDVTTPRPTELAGLWSRLLDRPVSEEAGVPVLRADWGQLRFLTGSPDRPELLDHLHLTSADPAAVIAKGRQEGCATSSDPGRPPHPGDAWVEICGVRFHLHEPTA